MWMAARRLWNDWKAYRRGEKRRAGLGAGVRGRIYEKRDQQGGGGSQGKLIRRIPE